MLQHVMDRHDPKRPATYQDVLDAPEHLVAEIVDGELFLSPRPRFAHADVAIHLIWELRPFGQRGGNIGGWRLLYEPEIHLASDIVVPDIAGWRAERLTNVLDAAFMTLAPDWVCEVLSPSTERLDRTKKLRVYAREGVSHAWLVAPAAQRIEVCERIGTDWRLLATYAAPDMRAPIRVVPFDAIAIDPAILWAGLGG